MYTKKVSRNCFATIVCTSRRFASATGDNSIPIVPKKSKNKRHLKSSPYYRPAQFEEPHPSPATDALHPNNGNKKIAAMEKVLQRSSHGESLSIENKLTQNTYRETLSKPLSMRRTPLQHRVNKELQVSYDPALVVRIDSRKKEIRLNPIQKELVWSARQKTYQGLLVRVVTCLQSHQSAVEKCHTLFALHEEVIRDRLRLRTDTYEDIFHTLYAVAVQGKAHHTLHHRAGEINGDSLLEEEVIGSSTNGCTSLSAPEELRSPFIASQTLLGSTSIQKIWTMYRYMIDSGTNPSARIVQYVMGILDRALATHRSDPNMRLLTESKAHSLMMDLDRYHCSPSEFTINSYIGVCDVCGVMYLATARVADYLTRHERQAAPGLYTRLLAGLMRNGQEKEALSVVTTIQNVPLTSYLLNAILHVTQHSSDPMSTFTMYRAVVTHNNVKNSMSLRPSLHTFSILLEVIRQQQSSFHEIDFILREMKFFGVKGNGMVLNRILELLVMSGKRKEALSLSQTMRKKGIYVFDEQFKQLDKVLS